VEREHPIVGRTMRALTDGEEEGPKSKGSLVQTPTEEERGTGKKQENGPIITQVKGEKDRPSKILLSRKEPKAPRIEKP